MREKEKAKAYDKAIERTKKSYGNRIAEEIFPELKESEDEKIRRWIIDDIRYNINNEPLNNSEYKKKAEKAITWLEKQRDKDKLIQELGEYKVKYTQEVLEKYINSMSNKDDERLRKIAIAFLKDFAEQGYGNAVECIDWLEKQGEQKPCMVQWKGDNLKEVIGFTGKDKNFEKWFKSFEEYEKYVHEHNNIFKLFSENGNHYEIPVGAWIIRTPDGYNIASKAVLKQKSADKIEPTFKVGNWVVNKFGDSWHIDSLDKKNYQVSDGKGNYNYFPISKQDEMHLWTIQDARDGDVLEFGDHGRLVIGILSYINKTTGKVDVSCLLECNKFKVGVFYNLDTVKPYPVTKEQRDALMKAMNDARYKWNTETKTLEKLVEPKFKVGDKIVNLPMKYMGGSWTQGTISKITDDKYIFTDSSYISISSQDSWELVDDKKSKFDPKTLKPFDRVLVRDSKDLAWNINMFFYIDYPYRCLSSFYRYCIPYNNDTKHLIGITDEAPEYYRYWED